MSTTRFVSQVQLAQTLVEVLRGERGPCAAMATVIGRSGSAPQVVGARLIVLADGTSFGTVGGGAIEAKVLESCRNILRTGKSEIIKSNLVRDLGMCCGGSMEIFVEYVQPELRLIVIGAGHVAQALVGIAKQIGFRPCVVDDREDLLSQASFSEVETKHYDADELDVALPDLNEHDHVVIVTRDHARDEQALAALIDRPLAYLGMIGSRRKVKAVLARVLRRYEERDLEVPAFDHVHAPIGLALGGRTPGEIAVSIAAELIALRHGGNGTSMNTAKEIARSPIS